MAILWGTKLNMVSMNNVSGSPISLMCTFAQFMLDGDESDVSWRGCRMGHLAVKTAAP